MATKFHTCSLRCVFVHIHAAAKNHQTLFAAYAANSARLFDRSEVITPVSAGVIFWGSRVLFPMQRGQYRAAKIIHKERAFFCHLFCVNIEIISISGFFLDFTRPHVIIHSLAF